MYVSVVANVWKIKKNMVIVFIPLFGKSAPRIL